MQSDLTAKIQTRKHYPLLPIPNFMYVSEYLHMYSSFICMYLIVYAGIGLFKLFITCRFLSAYATLDGVMLVCRIICDYISATFAWYIIMINTLKQRHMWQTLSECRDCEGAVLAELQADVNHVEEILILYSLLCS